MNDYEWLDALQAGAEPRHHVPEVKTARVEAKVFMGDTIVNVEGRLIEMDIKRDWIDVGVREDGIHVYGQAERIVTLRIGGPV